MQRYDFNTDKWWLIPTKIHKAQITGDLSSSVVSMEKTFFHGTSFDSQVNNGISISTEMETILGANLHYNGPPVPISIPDLESYKIQLGDNFIRGAFINSININVDFPTPATITYSFDFPIDSEGE